MSCGRDLSPSICLPRAERTIVLCEGHRVYFPDPLGPDGIRYREPFCADATVRANSHLLISETSMEEQLPSTEFFNQARHIKFDVTGPQDALFSEEELGPATLSAGSRRKPIEPVHFLSESCDWSTPRDLFDVLNREFKFELDVCASPKNAKCSRYYTKGENGLEQAWEGACWCHPPHGRGIRLWLDKAVRVATEGQATVVCLVPARTDTDWWHECVSRADEVRFVRGRLRFGGHRNSAPVSSAVVVFLRSKSFDEPVNASLSSKGSSGLSR